MLHTRARYAGGWIGRVLGGGESQSIQPGELYKSQRFKIECVWCLSSPVGFIAEGSILQPLQQAHRVQQDKLIRHLRNFGILCAYFIYVYYLKFCDTC